MTFNGSAESYYKLLGYVTVQVWG